MFISKCNLEGAKAKQELSVMVLCAYLITNLNLHSFFIRLGTKKNACICNLYYRKHGKPFLNLCPVSFVSTPVAFKCPLKAAREGV